MSETAAPPAPTGIGEGTAQALLQSAASLASSPLEAGLEWQTADTPQPQPDNALPSSADDYQRRFDAARQRDKKTPAQAQNQPANQPAQAAQNQQPNQPAAQENPLQFKRKTAKDWDAMHQSHNQRVKQLETELEQYKSGKPPTTPTGEFDISKDPRFEQLKKERDEYFDVVKLTRAEMDPEFKARFDTKRTAAINIAKFAAGGASDKIAKILEQPSSEFRDAQLAEAIKDFSDGSKAKIMAAYGQLHTIDVEKQIELETRKATWDYRQAQEQAKSQEMTKERLGQVKSAFNKELKRWQDPESGMPFTIPNENNPMFKSIAAKAEEITFGRLKDDAELAQVGIKAATFDYVIQYAANLADEYETLKAHYDRVMGNQPDTSGYVANPMLGTAPANAGPGNGTAVPNSTPLLLQGHSQFEQQLNARRNQDALSRR